MWIDQHLHCNLGQPESYIRNRDGVEINMTEEQLFNFSSVKNSLLISSTNLSTCFKDCFLLSLIRVQSRSFESIPLFVYVAHPHGAHTHHQWQLYQGPRCVSATCSLGTRRWQSRRRSWSVSWWSWWWWRLWEHTVNRPVMSRVCDFHMKMATAIRNGPMNVWNDSLTT